MISILKTNPDASAVGVRVLYGIRTRRRQDFEHCGAFVFRYSEFARIRSEPAHSHVRTQPFRIWRLVPMLSGKPTGYPAE
jgi:hypothetical protein